MYVCYGVQLDQNPDWDKYGTILKKKAAKYLTDFEINACKNNCFQQTPNHDMENVF